MNNNDDADIKVADATCAVTNVDDYSGSARLLAATTLRNVLGTKNLGDILSERESIAHELHELLYEATEPWGVQVERVEVKTNQILMGCSLNSILYVLVLLGTFLSWLSL